MKKIFSILLGLILSFALIGCQSVAEPEMNTPNTENEINQPQQDIDDLKIIAKGAPVEVRLASDGHYSYEYDKDEYTVTTVTNGSTFEIKVTDNQPEADSENQNHPEQRDLCSGHPLLDPAVRRRQLFGGGYPDAGQREIHRSGFQPAAGCG